MRDHEKVLAGQRRRYAAQRELYVARQEARWLASGGPERERIAEIERLARRQARDDGFRSFGNPHHLRLDAPLNDATATTWGDLLADDGTIQIGR